MKDMTHFAFKAESYSRQSKSTSRNMIPSVPTSAADRTVEHVTAVLRLKLEDVAFNRHQSMHSMMGCVSGYERSRHPWRRGHDEQPRT